jgi:hypothetical protein
LPGGSILSPEKNGPAKLKDLDDVLCSYITRINHLYQILDKNLVCPENQTIHNEKISQRSHLKIKRQLGEEAKGFFVRCPHPYKKLPQFRKGKK